MRKKKLLATAVAGTLVAAQMAMPVMAADGGEVEVDVTTKTAVIRVEVPTSMVVSVDQFMMGDGQSQVYSEEFTMANKSAVAVKVTVTSTADLASTTKLVATKAGAKDSTKEGEAWLGMAAQTKAGGDKYDDPNTDTSDADNSITDTPETIGTLTEANANVATFVQGTDADAAKGKASQVFYLAKGDGNTTYTMLHTSDDPTEKSYAQFYELKAETITDDASAQGTLNALVAAKDVYVATGAASSNQSLTLVAKGTTTEHPYDNGEIYYTAAETPTASSAILAENTRVKLYVYGGKANAATTGGNAAFRYIGALSGAQESWTKTDISKITIKYDIVGVDAEKYGEVEDDCKYGLYISSTPAVPESDGTAAITISYTGAKPAALTIVPVNITGSNKASFNLAEGAGNLTITNSSVTLSASYISMLKNAATRGTGTYKFTINGTEYTFVIK